MDVWFIDGQTGKQYLAVELPMNIQYSSIRNMVTMTTSIMKSLPFYDPIV